MRNTLLLQLPGVRKLRLYYIAVPVLLLCLALGTACPVYADETADLSSSSTSDSTDTDDDLSRGGDVTDAYDKYAGGVDSGLNDVKNQYDGVVDDSVLGFVGACTAWIPADIWVIVGLSIAHGRVYRDMYRCTGAVPAPIYTVRLYGQLLGRSHLVANCRYRDFVYKGAADR